MEFKRSFLTFFFAILMGFLSPSKAYKFLVGGKDGWVVAPSEDYNHWAGRMRFQVNDTLYFKYKKGSDSVLVVTKDDYYSCNMKNPVKSFTDGDSTFTFDHSGPYFFISGNADSCNKGQKLIVVVMAVRDKTYHHHAPPSPAPVASPPPAASPSPAYPPSVSTPWQSPKASPPAKSPKASSPAGSPKASPPTESPKASPPAKSPKASPPAKSPKASPPAGLPKASPPAGSPKASPPAESPKTSPPAELPPVQPPLPSDTPSDSYAPAPAPTKSGSKGLDCSVRSVLGFSVGVSLVLGSFLGV